MKSTVGRSVRRPAAKIYSVNDQGRFYLTGCVFFILLITLLAGTQSIRAADGDLDTAFGIGGKVVTDFDVSNDLGNALAIQPDKKIVVAGKSGTYPVFHSALARYNADGSLDQSFGLSGKVVIALNPNGDRLISVVILPDGKILAAGSFNETGLDLSFLVVRFNPDGSLDRRFGHDGSTMLAFGDRTAEVGSLLLQPDGKILIAGTSGGGQGNDLNDFALARFDEDGTPDQSFGVDGKLKTHFSGQFSTGTRVGGAALQRDGKIVVAGSYKNEGVPWAFAVARYNPDGSLDTSFGNGGTLATDFGREVHGNAVVLQADGKIVVGGHLVTGFYKNNEFALARYDINGGLDPTFGSGGKIVEDLYDRTNDVIYSLSLQRDGKLIAAGRTGQGPSLRFVVVRFNSNGEFDLTFGTGGKVLTDFNGTVSEAFSSAVQKDGKIIIAGYSGELNAKDFTLVRYRASTGVRKLDLAGDTENGGSILMTSGGVDQAGGFYR